jgi:hypothetical protein
VEETQGGGCAEPSSVCALCLCVEGVQSPCGAVLFRVFVGLVVWVCRKSDWLMRRAIGISVCLVAAMSIARDAACASGAGIEGVPPPAPSAPPAAEPRSLWCENVVEMQTARRSGVTSVWLSNGVRVHHLKVDKRLGQVVATIAISGGKLLEDGATRGVSEIAAGVLDDWDAAAPNASGAERMAGRDIRIDAGAGPDAITLRLSGAVADAGAGMRVVRELLTDPKITPEAVETSREMVVRELRARSSDARAAVSDAINVAVGGSGDPRMLPPEERALKAMNVEGVRGWLQRHVKEDGAPIEVAIVGDLTLAEALALVDTTLGTLPKRPRVSPATNIEQRVMAGGDKKGAAGPIRKDIPGVAQVGAGRATVVCGCAGPEMGALAEQRTLRALVRIAITRVKARLAAPELGVAVGGGEVQGGVYVSPFIGRGMVLLTATVDATKAAIASEAMENELARLAAEPATAEEIQPHALELAKTVEDVERDARYWSAALARCDALGMDPDEIASGASFYKALTPEQVRDGFRKFWRDEARIALTIRGPERPAAPVEGGKR